MYFKAASFFLCAKFDSFNIVILKVVHSKPNRSMMMMTEFNSKNLKMTKFRKNLQKHIKSE